MTERVTYTNYFYADSSVIDTVYYDKNNHRMYVTLRTGARPAYKNVDELSYVRFKNAQSQGAHWNYYIKNKFPGINGDVILDYVSETADKPVESAKVENNTYLVRATIDIEITVEAPSDGEALVEAQKMLDKVQNATVKIKEVVRTFE